MSVKRAENTRTTIGRQAVSGTRLAALMIHRRLSKLSVCIAINSSERQLYNYMTGKYRLSVTQVNALCRLLEVQPDGIVDDDRFLRRD